MFALLGDIQFDLITYFDGMDAQFGADFAEHPLIEGKPRLQWVGDRLDEFRIDLSFHAWFCEPETELVRLRQALQAHMAMSFVLGNGDYKGWFVLTDVQAMSRQTDQYGTLTSLEATITLREYVGDKNNPLPPPAVRPKLAPAAAQANPISAASGAAGLAGLASAANTVRDGVRQAVTLANQAQSSLRVVSDGVRLAQQLRSNPLAALGRVPALMTGLGQVAGPLASLSPTIAGLSSQLPEVSGIVRSATNALGAIRNGQNALSLSTVTNVVGRLDYLAGQVNTASDALASAAPAISKLTAKVVTRLI